MKSFSDVEHLSPRQKRIAGILSVVILLLFMCVVAWIAGRPIIRFVSEPGKFRSWVDSHGFLGRIIFVAMMVFQMIFAIIPGEPLEIGAGYAFGAVEGTLLCVIGNIIGGALIFLIVRTVGIRWIEIFYPREKILSLKFLQNSRRFNVIVYLVFLIPGTPKDLLSYVVGLTDMKWSTWLFITGIARLPSVITSILGGNALGSRKYGVAVAVFAITAAISMIGLFLYKLLCRHHSRNYSENNK